MDDLTKTVDQIHFVAHENANDTADPPLPPTNHWTIFMELGSGGSARIEAVPGADSTEPGMILIESKPYAVSSHISHRESATPPNGTTMEGILSLLIKNKRDQYRFTDDGEGCRYWCKVFAEDLAAAGLIPGAAQITSALGQYWKYKGGSEPRELGVGTFFD